MGARAGCGLAPARPALTQGGMDSPDAPDFSDRCDRCAALCCVAHAFDAGDAFAVDKPTDRPCTHLTGRGLCAIHDSRAEAGYPGCIAYRCYGAGQYVTQVMFGGQTWQDRPELLAPMCAALRDLRPVQQWRAMLAAAQVLPLPPAAQEEAGRLAAALAPDRPWTPEALAALHASDLPSTVRQFFRGLRQHLPNATSKSGETRNFS